MGFRVAVVTDIHHGIRPAGERGGNALSALKHFVDWVGKEKPDLVLELGDRIADVDSETDKRLQREVAEMLSRLDAPVQSINGNHDRDNLSIRENEQILGYAMGHEVLDAGDWRIILWRADTQMARGWGLSLPKEDLEWLKSALLSSDKPTLLASHVPPFAQDMTTNHYFEANAEIANYRGCEEISSALISSTCPLVTVSGHVHWTTAHQRGGVWHLTQQALTEIYPTGAPAMAWGMLDLGADVSWDVHGVDPMSLRFTPSAKRWARPLPRFSDMPATA